MQTSWTLVPSGTGWGPVEGTGSHHGGSQPVPFPGCTPVGGTPVGTGLKPGAMRVKKWTGPHRNWSPVGVTG